MLNCDAQNRILLKDIIDAVNANEADVISSKGDIILINTETESNTVTVADHEIRLNSIETSGATLPAVAAQVSTLIGEMVDVETKADQNEIAIAIGVTEVARIDGDLLTITTNILGNDGRITQNEADILLKLDTTEFTNALLTAISGTNKLITQADLIAELNKYAVSSVDNASNKLVTDLYLRNMLNVKRYSIIKHTEGMGIPGGASVAGSWQTRTLNNAFEDNLNLLQPGNKLSLSAGSYAIQGFAVAEGSYHQCRVYDNTGGAVLTLGSSGNGISLISSTFTLAVASEIEIQSQVDVSVPASGYGLPNPFDQGVFSEIKITKLGV